MVCLNLSLYVSGRFLFFDTCNSAFIKWDKVSLFISPVVDLSPSSGWHLRSEESGQICLPFLLFVSVLFSADICNRRRLQLGKVPTHIFFPL